MATEDALYRHYLDAFGGYDTGRYEVIQEPDAKQYLLMNITISSNPDDGLIYSEEDTELVATPENMKKCFGDTHLISADGRFVIPEEFEDYIYPEDPKGVDNYIDNINVLFRFRKLQYADDAKHKDVDLRKYIKFE